VYAHFKHIFVLYFQANVFDGHVEFNRFGKAPMRLLLLNQFGSDSGAPTGRILGELGTELEKRGHTVQLLVTDSGYGKPRKGIRRLMEEGLSHLRLLGRGLCCPRADAIISLTSPACLAVTAGVVARIHRAKHFHWAMDLYPDVGVSLGELKQGLPVRIFSFLVGRAYQGAHQVVTLDEDMREYVQAHYKVDSAVIEPFPPEIAWPAPEKNLTEIRRWLYSGNFGRAHEIQILLQIQKRLEDKKVPAELILQGQGPQFLASRDAARNLGLRSVQWREPVSLERLGESLLQSDVLVVTRKAELKGLLLPSKLMLAELSGRAVLWIGDTDGKTAQRLSRERRHGVFTIADVEPIASWLQARFEWNSSESETKPKATAVVRQKAADQWQALLIKSQDRVSSRGT